MLYIYVNYLSDAQAWVGEYFTFQIGLYAGLQAIRNVSLQYSDLTPATASNSNLVVPASAWNCINLGGTDSDGQPFQVDYSISKSRVGALWVGLTLPADLSVNGTFTGKITLSAAGYDPVPISLSLDIRVPESGQPIADQGQGDIYSMSRLAWLDSRLGIDDTVTHPYAPLQLTLRPDGGLTARLVNKFIDIGANGLPEAVTVTQTKIRQGSPANFSYVPLKAPGVGFSVLNAAGEVIQMKIAKTTTVLTQVCVSLFVDICVSLYIDKYMYSLVSPPT